MKTKQELIDGAGDDREPMIKELDRFGKVQSKSNLLIGISILLGVISIALINVGYDWAVIGLIPIPFLLIYSQINMVRGCGLI